MRYPALDRLLALRIPTLVVIGSRDPLMPGPPRIQEVAGRTDNRVLLVVIDGAAHATNFSHPGELANVIRLFMADQEIRDVPTHPATPCPTRSIAVSTFLRRHAWLAPTGPINQVIGEAGES